MGNTGINMVDFEQLKTFLDKDGDSPVAYGVNFRDDKPYTTLHFVRADDKSVHMYVYVDEDYLPVGMALVHPPTSCVEYKSGSLEQADFKKLLLDLYGLLCQLSAWAQLFNKRELAQRSEHVVKKATDRARELEMKKAA